MANSNGTMVSRSMNVPLIEKAPHPKRESVAAVRVADFENGSGDGFSFSREQFEFAIRGLHDGKQSHWSMFDGHFYRQPVSNFSVIHLQRANLCLSFGDCDMPRSVVPHQQ